MLLIDPDQVNTASMATGPTPSYTALAEHRVQNFPRRVFSGITRCDRRRRRRMVNEVDNRPRCCHQARRTLKFSLDTTTHLTPGRVVGGSPRASSSCHVVAKQRSTRSPREAMLNTRRSFAECSTSINFTHDLNPLQPTPQTTSLSSHRYLGSDFINTLLTTASRSSSLTTARHHRCMMQLSGSITIADPLRPETSL